MNNLLICKQTRKIAANSLAIVLKDVLATDEPISEAKFRDLWLDELRKSSQTFPDGWYIPPPHGMIVLFGTDSDFSRIVYENGRLEKVWPREDVFLNRENGLLFFYSSPVNRKGFIIGDFSLSVYLGRNQSIQKHCKNTLALCREVFDSIAIGQTLSEVAKQTVKLMKKFGMYNRTVSVNAPNRGINIGHTIPGIGDSWSETELQKLNQQKDWQVVLNAIASRRKYVDEQDQTKIKANMAFTIEPRPEIIDNPNIPMVCYHTICCINQEGEKELLTGFDKIFKICGMEYMLN